jgi:hypothetical protein
LLRRILPVIGVVSLALPIRAATLRVLREFAAPRMRAVRYRIPEGVACNFLSISIP